MIIRFSHEFLLPPEEVYTYFQTPADWTRLFGFAGDVRDLGDSWYSVPLKRFPFPLEARNIEQKTNELCRWVFRGFWRGRGEVRLSAIPGGVAVEGYEEISVRWLFFLSPLVERLFLERSFNSVWEIGWHRLRKRSATRETA